MPENTASTTMMPHIGTSQWAPQPREPWRSAKRASTETCRKRNPQSAPKLTMDARSSSLFFMKSATASEMAAVTSMPT